MKDIIFKEGTEFFDSFKFVALALLPKNQVEEIWDTALTRICIAKDHIQAADGARLHFVKIENHPWEEGLYVVSKNSKKLITLTPDLTEAKYEFPGVGDVITKAESNHPYGKEYCWKKFLSVHDEVSTAYEFLELSSYGQVIQLHMFIAVIEYAYEEFCVCGPGRPIHLKTAHKNRYAVIMPMLGANKKF